MDLDGGGLAEASEKELQEYTTSARSTSFDTHDHASSSARARTFYTAQRAARASRTTWTRTGIPPSRKSTRRTTTFPSTTPSRTGAPQAPATATATSTAARKASRAVCAQLRVGLRTVLMCDCRSFVCDRRSCACAPVRVVRASLHACHARAPRPCSPLTHRTRASSP
eukprot:4297093-Prymnesium_polylepis.1